MPNRYFDGDMGIIWVQPDGPNTEPKPLLCQNTDGPAESLGDITGRMCKTASGWKTVHRTQGLPDAVTFSLESYLGRQRDWLTKQSKKRCPMPFYFHLSACKPLDIFGAYETGRMVEWGYITANNPSAMMRGTADEGDGAADAVMQSFDVNANPPVHYYAQLVLNTPDVADTVPLMDVSNGAWARCSGACGDQVDEGDTLVAVAQAAAAVTAQVWVSTDAGATWSATAADPFAVDEDIAAVEVFKVGKDTTRILVARGTTDAANPAEIAYSDDWGATWTNVDVGSVNAAYVVGGNALFALDNRNIWVVTDQGNVYQSDDGGVSWDLLYSPGTQLNAVHFADEDYGLIAGNAGELYRSVDGGAHWSALSDPTGGSNIVDVHAINSYRHWLVTDSAVYFSHDEGDNWTQRTLPVALTTIGDIDFLNEFLGVIVGSDGTDAYILRTVNGGWDWETYVGATSLDAVAVDGLNAAVILGDYDSIVAVGDLVGAAPVVYLTIAE